MESYEAQTPQRTHQHESMEEEKKNLSEGGVGPEIQDPPADPFEFFNIYIGELKGISCDW